MQMLRTIFWVVVAVALALFTKANWEAAAPIIPGRVAVKLWGDAVMEARLPILILFAFLLGLVPTWAWGSAVKWRLRRRLASAERALESITTQQRATDPAMPGAPASLAPSSEQP
ncbi:LapA family protein [Sphingobium sp. DEHP117]|uniref:LapA family protein n=1 Tax=Sphingobium sp. DEHP117 TaxID=2993436 RepID=UPI0027D5B732|nr:lipopolysaccharide assembly protein LapA domain-containing protein [Sphingobium sp. DEHP117]MDQ4420895.1 LapA family protein [Sphingobium sp. DEHP117]